MLRYVSPLTVGHLQQACKFFLAWAAYVSAYTVGIVHMIKIIIIIIIIIILNVKYQNS